MLKLFIALFLGLASPFPPHVHTANSLETDVTSNGVDVCPKGVINCICLLGGYTGGDNGHIPIPPGE